MSAAPKQCHYFTLRIKRLSCIKRHNVNNWQLQENQIRKSACNCWSRLVNEGFKGRKSELKAVLEVTTARPDKPKDDDATDTHLQQWRRDPAWPTRFWCDVWGRRDQWCVYCTPSLAVCSTWCSQPDLNLANLEATVSGSLCSGTPR